MTEAVYFDTSALAKWYLNEPRSEDVEEFIRARGPVAISSLTQVEMRSLLARRRREGCFGADTEVRVFSAFTDDIRQGSLVSHPLEDASAASAVNIIASIPTLPLRALDALHLAIVREIRAEALATADRMMIEAAEALGLTAIRFD